MPACGEHVSWQSVRQLQPWIILYFVMSECRLSRWRHSGWAWSASLPLCGTHLHTEQRNAFVLKGFFCNWMLLHAVSAMRLVSCPLPSRLLHHGHDPHVWSGWTGSTLRVTVRVKPRAGETLTPVRTKKKNSLPLPVFFFFRCSIWFLFPKSRMKTPPFISASYGGACFGGSVTGGRGGGAEDLFTSLRYKREKKADWTTLYENVRFLSYFSRGETVETHCCSVHVWIFVLHPYWYELFSNMYLSIHINIYTYIRMELTELSVLGTLCGVTVNLAFLQFI